MPNPKSLIHNPAFHTVSFVIAACLMGGCVSLQSEHKPSIVNYSWLESVTPGHPARGNEWVNLDLAYPRDSASGNPKTGLHEAVQDFLDMH